MASSWTDDGYYNSSSIIFTSPSGQYEYHLGSSRDVVHNAIVSLQATCDRLLDQLWKDFVYECRPAAINKKDSIENKIRELKTILSGLANVADNLCPTVAEVLTQGREDIGERLNPIPGFERIMEEVVSTRVARCKATLLALERRISRTSFGGFMRQVVHLQESHWPLSSSATAKVVKDLDNCLAQFRIRWLDETGIDPPQRASEVSMYMAPERTKLDQRILVMRYAYCITRSDPAMRKVLFNEFFKAQVDRAHLTRAERDIDQTIAEAEMMASRTETSTFESILSQRWWAKAYITRCKISDQIEDVEKAIGIQLRVLEHPLQNNQLRVTDRQSLDDYRDILASRKSQLKPTRTESRIHDDTDS